MTFRPTSDRPDGRRRSRSGAALVLAVVLFPSAAAAGEEPADLVLTGGTIVTMDDSRPHAQALAIRGDRIVAVGDDAAVGPWIGDRTQVIDLAGKLAVPGFIDSHAHFVSLGRSKMILDLSKARTWDEIVELVAGAAHSTPPGRWIVGRGWHQAKWRPPPSPSVQGYPTHEKLSQAVPDHPVEKLSQAVPDHPVVLTHGTGHMCLANARAMELAGVDRNTESPQGGEILRPIECFYASVTRKLADGTAFFPDERMTRHEALRSYTLAAAYAAFEADLKGSLTPGKLADVVVLSKEQAGRRGGPVEGRPHRAGGRDPRRPGSLHHRRRQGALPEEAVRGR